MEMNPKSVLNETRNVESNEKNAALLHIQGDVSTRNSRSLAWKCPVLATGNGLSNRVENLLIVPLLV